MQDGIETFSAGSFPHSGELGSVISCRGSEAHVALMQRPTPQGPRATVGKFVALKHSKGASVGMISEISSAAGSAAPQGTHAVAQVDLMGEITYGPAGMLRFDRGVREYPAIGDAVELLGRDHLQLIYSSFEGKAMRIGDVQEDGGVPALIDADGLVSKHFAVLGSTGVGKSSGTAVILTELIAAKPDVRVLLLDVHNEYSASFGARATPVDPTTLKLPFWLFNFEEFTDAIYGGRQAVMEELDILAELIPLAKASYANIKGGTDRSLLSRRSPRQGSGFTVDTPAPYMIQDLVSLIDDRMGKLENRATRMIHHRLMARIETIRNDPRYAFMFENANVGGDTMAAVLGQLFSVNTNRQGITVLKLAEFPGEVVDAVVCVVLRLAFEFGLWSDGGTPLLIVCEEAHRFAAADHSSGFAPARRALSRIAKEGRKYGVHLGLVTQRPAELDPTIVSQCSTLFMMRMANERDHSLLRSAVSDAAVHLLSLVPSLGTGEVVGVGEALPLPLRFSFKRLPRERLPASDQLGPATPMSDSERAANVEKAIDRWRRATSIQHGAPQEGSPQQQPAAASHQPSQAQHPAPTAHHHPSQPVDPAGSNALTRGLQAALANEGLFSRNRT
ncbi:MAG: ATP-binding protein [Rhizobium sp.]|nr:ATP-binding protein [Rhizobium sp.]